MYGADTATKMLKRYFLKIIYFILKKTYKKHCFNAFTDKTKLKKKEFKLTYIQVGMWT